MITTETLVELYGCSLSRAQLFANPLSEAMDAYDINTLPRITAFLAQVGHESGRLRYVREIWGPTAAQLRYEGRDDLGNTETGDGARYKGRGLIQITGRANYKMCEIALDMPLVEHPELLEQPTNAALSAAWYWSTRQLNSLADRGDFELITRRINGGLNGYADRVKLWEHIKGVLQG